MLYLSLVGLSKWFSTKLMRSLFLCASIFLTNSDIRWQALKEAFEVFCNKGVAGSTSAELLATFCDNLLKKGGSEKLSDEAIEDTLEKVCGPCRSIYFLAIDIYLYIIYISWRIIVYWLDHVQVVKLLAYISDKDLFAEFYRYCSKSSVLFVVLGSQRLFLV